MSRMQIPGRHVRPGHAVNQVSSARRGTVQDIRKLGGFDLLQLFSALFQLFECFHDGLGHAPVSFLGSADDGELITRGDALVTILIVETDAQEARGRFARLFLFAHAVTVLGLSGLSSGISSSTALQTMSENASS